jgi:hypothetical protein
VSATADDRADALVDASLGCALYALGAEFRTPDPDAVPRAEELDWQGLLQPGAEVALQRVQQGIGA